MTGMVDRLWYGRRRPLWPLWPLAWVYRRVTRSRRQAFLSGNAPAQRPPLPVVVIGNITAGGTGKSPLVLAVVSHLKAAGWRPVIISRGYGGKSDAYPVRVDANTPAALCGDEPKMLSEQAGVPVYVDPVRANAAASAYKDNAGDVLICDDGLQHYGLGRDIEIAVIDGARGFGNGAPIPVGPLRESPDRLGSVDAIVCNGKLIDGLDQFGAASVSLMTFESVRLVNLVTGEHRSPCWLDGQRVTAIAGIGHPARFFTALEALGANLEPQPRPDHHTFTAADLSRPKGQLLVMTAKDAVKCREFADDKCWSLEVEARLPDAFWKALDHKLTSLETTPGHLKEKRTDG
ncbi:tetraacyldisaccharide 4'-kinase [Marinobacter sp. BGYM27]|uniref:tetraacyldisaccharide 4'-kinase n=1 Tax=Marinobacter sp. BGYM27 TaxID=2975597 RepID=UPI0021A63DFB|nr:tetraacyldisaccharide 4'-kinase [Marinobacter sp. BGYM27]MDG5500486.1 tetraacyldisaccharide 4'-kinase [Marinobacter sp. BGYM27]